MTKKLPDFIQEQVAIANDIQKMRMAHRECREQTFDHLMNGESTGDPVVDFVLMAKYGFYDEGMVNQLRLMQNQALSHVDEFALICDENYVQKNNDGQPIVCNFLFLGTLHNGEATLDLNNTEVRLGVHHITTYASTLNLETGEDRYLEGYVDDDEVVVNMGIGNPAPYDQNYQRDFSFLFGNKDVHEFMKCRGLEELYRTLLRNNFRHGVISG